MLIVKPEMAFTLGMVTGQLQSGTHHRRCRQFEDAAVEGKQRFVPISPKLVGTALRPVGARNPLRVAAVAGSKNAAGSDVGDPEMGIGDEPIRFEFEKCACSVDLGVEPGDLFGKKQGNSIAGKVLRL